MFQKYDLLHKITKYDIIIVDVKSKINESL